MSSEWIRYKRSRFKTRLPVNARFTRAHGWMMEVEPGLWRVGITRFATRMLGELVEFEFHKQPGDRVEVGEVIGWVEGFKAVSEVYAQCLGAFAGPNPELEADPTLLLKEPYRRGWLYAVEGEPEPDSVDVEAYMTILDATIDKMLAEQG